MKNIVLKIYILIVFVIFFVVNSGSVSADDACGTQTCPNGSDSGYAVYDCVWNGYACVEPLDYNGMGSCVLWKGGPDYNIYNRCTVAGEGGIPPSGCSSYNYPCVKSTSRRFPGCCPPCPAYVACPSDCGYGGGNESDGSCGTHYCNATGSCCPAAGTCTTNCGANASVPDGSCGTTTCACIACGPDAPVIISPTPGAQLRVGVSATVDWNDIANWGNGCPNSNHYMACVSSDDVNCDLKGNWDLGLTSQYSHTFLAPDPTAFMFAAANNGSLSTWDDRRIDVCVEGGYSLAGAWTWPAACGPVSRTRTCSETCGTDDCNAFFASKVGCDVAANCSYVGNTQTETGCNQCAPSAPTCTSIAASTDSTPAINWTSGGVTADTWFYRIDGGAAVSDSDLTASPAVSCGPHTWEAMARDNTCGNADSNWSGACNLCYQCSADAPTLSGPANGTEVHVNQPIVLSWGNIASWNYGCPNSNKYEVCLDNDMSGCDYGYISPASTPPTSQYAWTPTTADATAYWTAIADNGALESWSTETRNVCVEGFDGANVSYVSNWGAWSGCGVNHTRSTTRTCTETCGVDDCNAFMSNPANCPAGSTCTYNAVTKTQTRTEDCIATITGAFFDASDMSSCDLLSNPAKFSEATFGLTGPWPVISSPVATDLSGNYSESVYAPGVYTYDYTDFINSGRTAGVKFQCQSSDATVTTQGEVVVKDTGFWRVYGGWWQTVGGSVYAKGGIKSYVPASAAVADQKLIKADSNGRTGVLSYGVPWTGLELGSNPNMLLPNGVSDDWWRVESVYDGLRYDYNFYNTRMDVFTSTTWDGNASSLVYDAEGNDAAKGYKILKYTGSPTLSQAVSIAAGQKIVLLVNGDVSINSNVVVPVGAFLGIIARGNITFGSAVTSAQGWFVAERINIPCNDTVAPLGTCDTTDVQFGGEGSFVGWTGISLSRDMYTGNNSAPAEKFTYRPDMFINVPTPMKVYTKEFSPFIP